jgi:hypothetical protein
LQRRTLHLLFVVCAPGGRRTCHDRMSTTYECVLFGYSCGITYSLLSCASIISVYS